jgi:Protein of unknown function DUF58
LILHFISTMLLSIRQRMTAIAEIVRLPLRAGAWSGQNGSILGQGTGSSLDFQDQRPYMPGDDPRHINWQAFARNGSYTMKQYRQEVSPRVDLLLDVSPSMFVGTAKEQRVWELAYFCTQSALRLGASLRVYAVGSSGREVPIEHVLGGDWRLKNECHESPNGPRLDQLPLRSGALRVLISDLLFPAAPELLVNPLTHNKSRGIIFAPYAKEESQPDWSGNIEFDDSESAKLDKRRVDAATLAKYNQAYQRHFDLWREHSVRRGIALARVPSEPEFLVAIRAEGVTTGAIEI